MGFLDNDDVYNIGVYTLETKFTQGFLVPVKNYFLQRHVGKSGKNREKWLFPFEK